MVLTDELCDRLCAAARETMNKAPAKHKCVLAGALLLSEM